MFEDTVLISAVVVGWGDEPKWGGLARPAHRFMCFDKATGELRWLNGTGISPYDTTYSTPTVMPHRRPAGNGVRLRRRRGVGHAAAHRQADLALSAVAGWHQRLAAGGAGRQRLRQPQRREHVRQFARAPWSHWTARKSGDLTGTELWQHLQVMAGKSSPVLYDGRLYVVDDRAKLYIYDAKTGKLIARKALGNVMRSTPLVADGKIYICTNNGQWYILRPTERRRRRSSTSLRLSGDESDGSPIVSHGRIYLPTSEVMYCLGIAESAAIGRPDSAAAARRPA